MNYELVDGVVQSAEWYPSSNFDARESGTRVSALIVHSISLPPGEYGGDSVLRFFQNKLKSSEHPYFSDIAHLKVSTHFLIRRDGELIQLVNTNDRAWHAGESVALETPRVNDFSIGVELEGWDEDPNGFTHHQYQCLATLFSVLAKHYAGLSMNRIFAHSDIAPGRKPDPGTYFQWSKLFDIIDKMSIYS